LRRALCATQGLTSRDPSFHHGREIAPGLDPSQGDVAGTAILAITMFEPVVINCGREKWEWQVRDPSGKTIMRGWEKTREAARYQVRRALFLLLLSSHRQLK
jgi:hypothetical protein